MKKILILFLLSFPIIIFTIVTLTSTIIAYNVPLAVSNMEIISGEDIGDNSTDKTHLLELQIYPTNARNTGFTVVDENNTVLFDYNHNGIPTINNLEEHVIEVKAHSDFNRDIKTGNIKLAITTKNYGFTQLTVITKDGNYRKTSDITVLDSSKDPTEIQGVVLDYNKTNEHYLFGNKNTITVGFTYFPKTAINVSDQTLYDNITNALRDNALALDFQSTNGRLGDIEITSPGRGEITIRPNLDTFVGQMKIAINVNKEVEYSFNVNEGYNIVSEAELFANNNKGANLYLLNHIELNNLITFYNGTKLYGNYFQINHSGLNEYDERNAEGKLLNAGKKAITFTGNNSGLYQVHIIGKLDENQLPYENIINVSMDARSVNDKHMFVKDVIIENGRYNLAVRGMITTLNEGELPTTFELDEITLIGAYLASLEIDNQQFDVTDVLATEVNVSRLNISYTAIGIILQNNRNSNPYSKLHLVYKEGHQAITSTSWRNLDDASGALSANNFGAILKELKSDTYKDVYYKDGKDFYVNPVIMLRGGGRNRSIVTSDELDLTMVDLIKKERTPTGFIEVAITGGTHPFVIYLLKPEKYNER